MVISRVRAFSTLAAIVLLVLIIALIGVAMGPSEQGIVDLKRSTKLAESQARVWKSMNDLLRTLVTTWNSDEQTLGQWWTVRSAAFDPDTTVLSLSGQLNLNSLSPFLLLDSALATTLSGKSVDDFVTYRSSHGPFADLAAYSDYFNQEALANLYCSYSFFNVNTADEIMIEKVLAVRTGSEAFASTIRTQLRNARQNRQILSDSDWQTLLGGDNASVGGLMTTQPELNVNDAPVEVLQALLLDPDFAVPQAPAILQTLLTGRQAKPWTDASILALFGGNTKTPILPYLGTRTQFLQLGIPGDGQELTVVVALTYSTDSPPQLTPRILSQTWSPR